MKKTVLPIKIAPRVLTEILWLRLMTMSPETMWCWMVLWCEAAISGKPVDRDEDGEVSIVRLQADAENLIACKLACPAALNALQQIGKYHPNTDGTVDVVLPGPSVLELPSLRSGALRKDQVTVAPGDDLDGLDELDAEPSA